MFKKLLTASPFTTFYVVFTYIMAFSLWWAYLLYAKNETAYSETIQAHQLRYEQVYPDGNYSATVEYQKFYSKYQRQKLMIVTEGSVFILLLLLGLLRVRKVFLSEMQLASQQRNFLLSITHELKSPLSTVKLSLQTLAKRKLEPEQTDKLIDNSLVDLERLEELVDNILFAAKIERNETGFNNEEINVSEVVTQTAERFANNKKKIKIDTQISDGIYMNVDVLGFTSVITNLVENAVKYSEPETSIIVSLSESESEILLSVADEGVGINDEDKARIFDKFYRAGNENTRKAKGTGLGLYIVKRFVEIYKGNISVFDNKVKGTIFRISFTKL